MRPPFVKSPRELALTLRRLAQTVADIPDRDDLEAAAALLAEMHETPLPLKGDR